jgi:YD repeat-containing protein
MEISAGQVNNALYLANIWKCTKCLSIVYLLIILSVSITSGCSSTPSTHNHTIDVSHDLKQAPEVIDANIGVFFDKQTSSYIHEQAFSDSITTMNVGEASAEVFGKAIPMTFRSVAKVQQMPPYDVAVSNYDGIIEPRIDYVNWRTGFESQDDYYHVEYTFILCTNTGVPLSMWRIRGDGDYLQDQIKDAAQKFVTEFSTAPETKSFRNYLATKKVGKVGFDTKKIDINAVVIDENPLGYDLIASGVLPVKVSVTNNTGYEITGRGYDVRLLYHDVKRIPPAFPLAVISSTEYLNAISKTDPAAVAAFFGPLAIIPMMAGQSSDQQETRKERVDYFDEARLKEITLQNGQSIEGKIFFKLPNDLQKLDDAKLSLWFIDKNANNGSRKVIQISDINYKKLSAEELQIKADEMRERQEALEPVEEVVNQEDEF